MIRFIESSSRGSAAPPSTASGPPGLYRVVSAGLITLSEIQTRAAQLARIAEFAYGRRDLATVERAGREIASLPSEPAQNTGLYYLAISAKWLGRPDEARAMLEAVSGSYKARAIQALGAIHFEAGKFDDAGRMHHKASLAARGIDALTSINSSLQMSAIKSVAGDHERALDDLLALWPIIRLTSKHHPHLWPMLHNEIAFELLQLGRVEQAGKAASVALASPISDQYPEWRETAEEIRQAHSAAIVIVARAPQARPAKQKRECPFTARCGKWRSSVVRSKKSACICSATLARPIIEQVQAVAPCQGPPSHLLK